MQDLSTEKKHKYSVYQKIMVYNDSGLNYTSTLLFFGTRLMHRQLGDSSFQQAPTQLGVCGCLSSKYMGTSGRAAGKVHDITETSSQASWNNSSLPCPNRSVLTRCFLPACPYATVTDVCCDIFNIWVCLQRALASICQLSGLFTNAHWLRKARGVDLSLPDFKKRWLGTTPRAHSSTQTRLPLLCAVVLMSGPHSDQTFKMTHESSFHLIAETHSRCAVIIMCLIVSQQENTLEYTTCTVHSGITVPLLLIC